MNAIKPKLNLKPIIYGTVGNLVEWYDWFTFAVFSIYFAPAFFPHDNPTVQLLNTSGIFAIGFLSRPIGGLLLGRYADKWGRKKILTLSVILMCTGSLIIACMPTYESIGIIAPCCLLFARILQGLSIGGEEGTVAAYLSELAPPDQRGFYASFQAVTITLGQVIALSTLIILQYVLLTHEQLAAWGWRIPFVIGALLAVIAFFLRKNLRETDIFKKQKKQNINQRGTLSELLHHRTALMRVFFITLGGTVAYYTFTTYMLKYLVNTVGFSNQTATLLSFFSLTLFLFIQPVLGRLSDRVGRKPILMAFGITGILGTIPILSALEQTTSVASAFVLMLLGLLIVSGYTSVNPIAKAELFPTEIRALGVSFSKAVVTAVFGGTVEYVALYFKYINHEYLFFIYVTACIFISLVGFYYMPDPKKTSLIDRS
jgi:MHS family alpha-ketoglutarate permease-like MFS transporter